MDPEEQAPLSFTEFAQQYTKRIDQGERVSVINFLSEAQEYAVAKTFFLDHKDIVYSLLTDPDGAPSIIRDILDNPTVFLSSEGTGISNSEIQKQKAWEVLRESRPQKTPSAATRESWGIVQENLENTKAQVANARKIVQEFNSRVQKLQIYGAQTPPPIDVEKQETLPTFEEIRKNLIQEAKTTAQKQQAQQLLSEYEPRFNSKEYQALRAAEVITAAVIETPEAPMKVLVEAAQRGYDRNRATAFAYMATVVNTPSVTSAVGAPANVLKDVVTTVFPNIQYASAERIVADAWDRVITKSESTVGEIADRVGEGVAQSEEFRNFIKRGNEFASSHRGTGIGSMVSGFTTSTKLPDESIEDYAELLYKKNPAARINPNEVMAGHAIHVIHLDIGGSPLEWIAQWLASKKTGAVVKTAVGAGAKATAKEVGAAFLAKIGIKWGATFLSGPVGWALVIFGDKLAEWGTKAAAGLTYMASGGNLIKILKGENPSLLDTFAVLPWVVLGFFALFLLLPLPTNFIQFPEVVRNAAFVAGMGGEGPGGAPTDCNATPEAPVCSFEECTGDCRWPTDGRISQGPRPSCGSHSGGEDENGIDIASDGEPTVYAMVDGTVEAVNASCPDYSGSIDESDPQHLCGDGYGNYVIVSGTASNGKTYRLIFGHMLSAIPVRPGDHVTPRSPVGRMDHTGYSSGAHLHFGVLSGGNVLDLIPDNDPGLSKAEINGCNKACGRPCPSTPVSSS